MHACAHELDPRELFTPGRHQKLQLVRARALGCCIERIGCAARAVRSDHTNAISCAG